VRSLAFIALMNVGASYEMMIFFAMIYCIFDYSTVPPTASLSAAHLGLKIMASSPAATRWAAQWEGSSAATSSISSRATQRCGGRLLAQPWWRV
jgi:hypothetical protein